MPPENFESVSEPFGTLSMLNSETGEEFEFEAVQGFTLTDNTYEINRKYNMPICNNATITLDTTTTLSDDLHKLMGFDVAKMPDAYNVEYFKPVQIRKHKKKRINKKWAKKYGYTMQLAIVKGWRVETHGADGYFEFVK